MNDVDSSNNKRANLSQSLGWIFNANKALGISLWKGYFILNIANQVNVNGKVNFDYNNTDNILLDYDDLRSLRDACMQLGQIYYLRTKDPNIVLKNNIFKTNIIEIPILNKQEGKVVGNVSIGLFKDSNSDMENFAIRISGKNKKNNTEYKNFYTFKSIINKEQCRIYKENEEELLRIIPKHSQFIEFLNVLHSLVFMGRLIFSSTQKNAEIVFSKNNGGGGGKYNNDSSNSSGNNSNPKYNTEDDIPF